MGNAEPGPFRRRGPQPRPSVKLWQDASGSKYLPIFSLGVQHDILMIRNSNSIGGTRP